MKKVYRYDPATHYYLTVSHEAADDYKLQDGESTAEPKLAYLYNHDTKRYFRPQLVNPDCETLDYTFVPVVDGEAGTPTWSGDHWDYPDKETADKELLKRHPELNQMNETQMFNLLFEKITKLEVQKEG